MNIKLIPLYRSESAAKPSLVSVRRSEDGREIGSVTPELAAWIVIATKQVEFYIEEVEPLTTECEIEI